MPINESTLALAQAVPYFKVCFFPNHPGVAFSVTISHVDLLLWSFPGILRYRVAFQDMEYQGEDDEFFDLDDY